MAYSAAVLTKSSVRVEEEFRLPLAAFPDIDPQFFLGRFFAPSGAPLSSGVFLSELIPSAVF